MTIPDQTLRDIAAAALTVFGEADPHNRDDAAAIAGVIVTRLERSARHMAETGAPLWWGGPSLESICYQAYAFSCWNWRIKQRDGKRLKPGEQEVARRLSGHVDETGALLADVATREPWLAECAEIVADALTRPNPDGPDHYYATYWPTPKWARGREPVGTVPITFTDDPDDVHAYYVVGPFGRRNPTARSLPLPDSKRVRGVILGGGAACGGAVLNPEVTRQVIDAIREHFGEGGLDTGVPTSALIFTGALAVVFVGFVLWTRYIDAKAAVPETRSFLAFEGGAKGFKNDPPILNPRIHAIIPAPLRRALPTLGAVLLGGAIMWGMTRCDRVGEQTFTQRPAPSNQQPGAHNQRPAPPAHRPDTPLPADNHLVRWLGDGPGLMTTPPASILGGRAADPVSHPYFAQVQSLHDGNSQSECGGAVYDARAIITAAHCVTDERAEGDFARGVRVRIAPARRDDPQALSFISARVAVHAAYDPVLDGSYRDDIAVVCAPEDIPARYRLPGLASVDEGDRLTVIGMGLEDDGEIGEALKAADIRVTRPGVARITADGLDGSFAMGDSGGPVMLVGGGLAGVVSTYVDTGGRREMRLSPAAPARRFIEAAAAGCSR